MVMSKNVADIVEGSGRKQRQAGTVRPIPALSLLRDPALLRQSTAVGRLLSRHRPWPLVLGLCLLSACSSASKPAPVSTTPPTTNGYKVGRPYAINGIWYVPRVDYDYDATGVASWYGPGFDGQATANGETYDMNELTAAHKTLPMPSIVRVTNLDNGRSIKLRVNDRGPFVDGRIIDVSRRAAQLLGFYGAGTARVRVEIVADESRALALLLTGSDQAPAIGATSAPIVATAVVADASVPAGPVPAAPAPIAPETITPEATAPVADIAVGDVVASDAGQGALGSQSARAIPAVAASTPIVASAAAGGNIESPVNTTAVAVLPAPPAAASGRAYVQAGAFAAPDNAKRAKMRLAGLGTVEIASTNVDGRNLFRVRLGPFPSDTEAHRVLAAAIREGFSGSRVVFE